jgi:hypothetical protein
MRNIIVEDRILARVARDAVGWDDGTASPERADIAVGRAVVALRVLGIGVTSEVTQTLRDDITLFLAEEAASPHARDTAAPAFRFAA